MKFIAALALAAAAFAAVRAQELAGDCVIACADGAQEKSDCRQKPDPNCICSEVFHETFVSCLATKSGSLGAQCHSEKEVKAALLSYHVYCAFAPF